MKNPAPHIRTSIYTLLNNNVVYNATPVPVYENEGEAGIPMQINVMEYSDADRSNRRTFSSNATQVIEVVAYQPTAARMYVDEVGELVMDLIKPNTKTVNNLSTTDIEVFVIGKPSQTYLTEESGEGENKIVRLILRYSLIVTQKT